jgi:hypothetical protein
MRLVYDLIPDLQAVNLAARAVLDPNNLLRAYLPIQPVDDVRYRLEQVQRNDAVGAVRAFGTPSRQIRRQGVVEVRGGLPAVSAMDVLTETDLMRAQMMVGANQDVVDAMGLQVTSAAARTALAVDNAYELLRGSVLSTGILSVDNGEVIQSADFGVSSDNKLAAGTAWTTTASADVIGDLMTWMDRYVTSAGVAPGVALTSRKVQGLMLRNAGLRALLAANGQVPAIASPLQLNQLLEAYGLPPILTYDRALDDGSGTKTRIIPENRFIFLPAAGTRVGATMQGITQQAVQLQQAGVLTASQVPGVSVATLVQDHPVAKFVNADSTGLPVIERPELLVTATVF